MLPNTLSAPVGALMRPTLRIESNDSLTLAAMRIRENGAGTLPVVTDEKLVGVLTEASLAAAMAAMLEATDAVEMAIVDAPRIHPYETGAEVLRRCLDEGEGVLVVVDDLDRVMGLVGPSDLWPRRRLPLKPRNIGGMATPFGVYLTTGTVSGGVHPMALVATGAVMSVMLGVSAAVMQVVADNLPRYGYHQAWLQDLAQGSSIVLFFLLMRLVPLSGTHGAEHQVVHAIERDEVLVPEVVRRMPRVHPRCGTNLVVGFSIFYAIASWEYLGDLNTRLLLAFIVTFALWRLVGGVVQQWVTTKRPSDRQLAGGIKAGEELLERYSKTHYASGNFGQRLLQSGIFHVMAGATIGSVALIELAALFGHPLPITLY